jgi:hypothetical protein
VFVFWWAHLGAGYYTEWAIIVVKSTDGGNTFSTPAVASVAPPGAGEGGDVGLNFAAFAFPRVAVNPVTGDLWIVYGNAFTFQDTPDTNIYVSVSDKGGQAWDPFFRTRQASPQSPTGSLDAIGSRRQRRSRLTASTSSSAGTIDGAIPRIC